MLTRQLATLAHQSVPEATSAGQRVTTRRSFPLTVITFGTFRRTFTHRSMRVAVVCLPKAQGIAGPPHGRKVGVAARRRRAASLACRNAPIAGASPRVAAELRRYRYGSALTPGVRRRVQKVAEKCRLVNVMSLEPARFEKHRELFLSSKLTSWRGQLFYL